MEKEELIKCMESPYYFFTNHIRFNNELVHTFLTEEEFNKVFKSYIKLYSPFTTYGS